MIVDSSALVAMLRGEACVDDLSRTIARAGGGSVPAPCYLETSMVMAGHKGPDSRLAVDALLATLGLSVVPLTERTPGSRRTPSCATARGGTRRG